MSDKKPESGKTEGEAPKQAAGKEEAAPGASGGGIKSWLPLIVTVVLMPVLAFATTKFLIIPKVVQAREASEKDGEHEEGGAAEAKHEGAKEPKESKDGKESKDHKESKEGKESHKGKDGKEASAKGHGKKKQSMPITKVIVNVAGSMGTRYLLTSFTLVGTHNDFKTVIEENKDQLLDLANTAMASKSISDLEKPGARNQIRSELMSTFNNALGSDIIQEIYFTEFAIQ